MAEPTAKVSMSPVFEARLKEIRNQAADEAEARRRGSQSTWCRPADLTTPLTDLDGIGEHFDRTSVNDAGVDAIKDADSPGVTGDVVAASLQIETLAIMERAFRQRHQSKLRSLAHAISRKQGHGSDNGPFIHGNLEYIRAILEEARRR